MAAWLWRCTRGREHGHTAAVLGRGGARGDSSGAWAASSWARRHGVRGCGGVLGRGRRGAATSAAAEARHDECGCGGVAARRGWLGYGRRRLKRKRRRMRSERTVKRMRSAFRAMTGRGGRMTGHGGGSVRSQSSKLLERPDASDYARSDADRVRSYFVRKTKMDDRTRWWWSGPDAVVSNCASGAASG
jgi:hypothetical protein